MPSGVRGRDGPLAQRLLRTLAATRSKYSGDDEDMAFLMGMVSGNDFQALMGVQQVLAQRKERSDARAEEDMAAPEALTDEGGELLADVCDMIFHSGVRKNSSEAKLLSILSSPHFHGIMSAHDRVSKKEYCSTTDWRSLVTSTAAESSAGATKDEADGMGDGTTNVRLQKIADQPLGATVKIRQADRCVVIGRVLHGSLAHQSGMLHSGDEVVSINGNYVSGLSVDQVVDLVKAARDHIDFRIRLLQPYLTSPHAGEECRITVRAQFDYDPRSDHLNPCREAGMAFDRGELLTVVSKADPRWWQAHRLDTGGEILAGLIPGPLERQRREAIKKRKKDEQQQLSLTAPRKRGWGNTRKRNRGYASTGREDPDEAVDFASYEEVARMLPKHREPRPLVLIGAAGVGCTEVQAQLIQTHRHLYARARPTSTMVMRGSASSQYQHVSVAEMLANIAENRFVEYSRVGNHWYGTSLSSIQRVQRAGRTCVLHVAPKTLRTMRIADIKPFVIFLAPPRLERLRAKLRHRDSQSHSVARSHRLEEQLASMVAASAKMERVHGHLFDLRLVHEDIDTTIAHIDEAMEKVRTEENWVPVDWVMNAQVDSIVEQS
eukprot:scpid31293/ scgid24497/ MAGUK p55 subfamily member 5